MADIKRRQSAVPYSDKAARIALLTERATLIAGYHGEESVAHADALQLLALDYYSEKRWAEDAALRVRALNIRRKLQGERKSVGKGKSVAVRVHLGGGRIKKK